MSSPSVGLLASYIWPHRRKLALALLLLLLTVAGGKAIPWILKDALDGLRDGRLDLVKKCAFAVLAIAGLKWITQALALGSAAAVGQSVELRLRNDVLSKLHQIGPSFLQRMPAGEVISRATSDVAAVRLLAGTTIHVAADTFLNIAATLVLMGLLAPNLTLYAVVPYGLVFVFAWFFLPRAAARSRRVQEAFAKLTERIQEHLLAVRVVRMYGGENSERKRFERENANTVDAQMSHVVLIEWLWPVFMALSMGTILIALWLGGKMVVRGELTVGEFAALNLYLVQLQGPMVNLGDLFVMFKQGSVGYARTSAILDASPLIADCTGPAFSLGHGELSVRDLSYSRSAEAVVLREASFHVPPKTSLAVVGRTGSGKTTLAALIARTLDTPPNSVYLDGQDVTKVPLEDLRRNIIVAQQEPFLFSDTVANNIGFALDDRNAPDAEKRIRHAAKQACVLDELEALPNGLNTRVGERGVQLSGGQRQRVALARLLLTSSPVVILDDPLSAVDAETEASVLQALEHAKQGRTLILITHRAMAAQHCQRIVVLEGGTVVEEGTHRDLLQQGGCYAEMVRAQTTAIELEESVGNR